MNRGILIGLVVIVVALVVVGSSAVFTVIRRPRRWSFNSASRAGW